MAGRAAQRALETGLGQKPVAFCDTVGCESKAFNRVGDRNLCQACIERKQHEEAEAACKAKGLVTTEQKRAYCRQMLKQFGHRSASGGFQRWADSMTQKTVDWIVLMGTKSDEQLLERLRQYGAIDGRNKLIPLDAREVAREAHRAESARQIAKVQEDLARLAEKFGAAASAETPQTEVKA